MRHLARSLRHAALAAAISLAALPALAAQPEDAWITTKVKVALLTDEAVHVTEINVDTVEGHVTLHGQVGSALEKAQAEQVARNVQGVSEVRNLLAVVPPARQKDVQVSDDALKAQVTAMLERDKALESSDISVQSVNGGVVLLAGEAKTLSAHRRAIEDVRAVPGVRRVASEIRSPNELADAEIWEGSEKADGAASDLADSASDAWLTTKAKVSLIAEPGLSPLAVSVDTRAGVVTLFGSVETQDLKSRAEATVRKIDGVKGVDNDLQVVPAVSAKRVAAADDQVQKNVKQRLGARDSLDDAKIDIAVENGVVRLTGTVATQSDRLTALTVARSTDGVGSVIDGLELNPKG